jgi:hypothetical protein
MNSKPSAFAGADTSSGKAAKKTDAAVSKPPSRLDQLEQLLDRVEGASLTEMTEATGWQQHSVRGAMAGALKKRGITITSEKVESVRRYRAAKPA